MCLTIDESKHKKNIWGRPKPLVAKEDIPVNKIVMPCGDYFTAPYRSEFRYTFGLQKKVSLCITRQYLMFEVSNGYHSYDTCEKAPRYILTSRLFDVSKTVRAIIPKGTKYYIGLYNELVSENIIIPDCRLQIEMNA